MQKVLSSDLWQTIRAQAKKSRQRKAAIAFVTRDLVGFRKEDTLVVDASAASIASGETDAGLLRRLHRRGVRLYHCAGLHAKVLLLDTVAVIGSGNMSQSSAEALVEAGVLTDHASTVSAVASLIEQLVRQSDALTTSEITRLCQIKVVRRGGQQRGGLKIRRRPKVSSLGNRTWLIGVRELVREPAPSEQKLIQQAVKTLRRRMAQPDYEADWIRWSGRSRFIRDCREGDSVVQIWTSHGAKRPSKVLSITPVLLKQKTPKWTRFYLGEPAHSRREMQWGKFQRFLKQLGHAKRFGPSSAQLLETNLADALTRGWAATAKT
jgi:hypothetical protein